MRPVVLTIALIQSIILVSAFVQPGDKIRGVNLGGWLMLEPWIRPSLYKQFETTAREDTAVDETTFNQRLGKEEATRQLKKHWDEWITEEDFKKIKSYGLNTVRIPYAWWHLGDSEEFVTAIEYLDKAVEWGNKHDVSILLDLHGVPGSQNGFDNSGLQCSGVMMTGQCATDCPGWPTFPKDQADKEYVVSILSRIATRYADQPSIWGIQPLNEPIWTIDLDSLKDFYEMTYTALRKIVPKWQIVMHDSFRYDQWQGFMKDESQYQDVMLDTHIYLAFDEGVMKMTNDNDIFDRACGNAKQVAWMQANELPTIVGEWSMAVDDCADWLTGFKQPSKKRDWFGLTCNQTRTDEFWTTLAKSMFYSYEQGDGWLFWNWKNELEPEWSYDMSVRKGWFPKDANDMPEFIKDAPCNS